MTHIRLYSVSQLSEVPHTLEKGYIATVEILNLLGG
jgi:hypothetical protein